MYSSSSNKGSRASSSSSGGSGSRISTLLLSMFATFAAIYIAGRLWQDAQNRVYLIKELDRITGQGQSAISVDDTLKIIACREQKKQLSAVQVELAAAKQEGFQSNLLVENEGAYLKKRLSVVVGVMTSSGGRKNRNAVRSAWMGTGLILKKMENEKGVVARFVIGRSENRGDELDRSIDNENRQTNDFVILDEHVETAKELAKKAKLFFAYAADKWDADYYAKVNDNIYVNIDALGATLATYINKPRAYIGCMKSGEVFSEPGGKWYEPDWWKFGDRKSQVSHSFFFLATRINFKGQVLPPCFRGALAQFISINRSILRSYAHDDVSAGSWFIGLDVQHIDEAKFCCSSWSSGAICAGV